MSNDQYTIRGVSTMDVYAGLLADASRAESEGMPRTGERQRKLALHLKNAERHLVGLCPNGYRVQMDVTFYLVPHVNPVLREDLAPNVEER